MFREQVHRTQDRLVVRGEGCPWKVQKATNQACGSSFFFFQAEDGIRDVAVTGVQTCALPILSAAIEDYSGDRQTSWRHRAAATWRGQTQRVGLCRIHIRMDLCVFCALSCWRWAESILAAGIIAAPSRLLPYPPCEPTGAS